MLVVWIAVAALLLAVEMHHLAFFAMFGAAGAAAAAVVTTVAPDAIGVQIATAAAVTVVGVVAVRPYVSKAFARHGDGIVVHGVHGGLVGARGTTIDEVPFHERGHVRLLGETWLAIAADEKPIAAATTVVVVSVSGTTLTVKSVPERELQ
ncbi:MAG: NfeD-like C-terminal, partner-binding [Ilumatobacteraceae bacterium]|nr:NfeD-like C-terminal, partner-binding [Ilumatobacteraceae bacterium]